MAAVIRSNGDAGAMTAVVHEIRNQLAILGANVEAFRDGKFAPTTARLNGMLQSLDAIDGLLTDVEPSVSPHSVRQEMDLCEVINRQLAAIEGVTIRHGIALEVRPCPKVHHQPCHHFLGDRLRIEEILSNVLLNAVRYTPEGGVIQVDCLHRDGEMRFRVTDNGPGVDPSEIDRIFELGYRGASVRTTRGSGVGLALSRKFAREHGGTITVEKNAAGRGALFTVCLPTAATSSGPPCVRCEGGRVPRAPLRAVTATSPRASAKGR